MTEMALLALLRYAFAVIGVVASRQCVTWARGVSRSVRSIIVLGLPKAGAEAMTAEIGADAEERIWQDLKAGLPVYEVAALAVFHALTILWSAPSLRSEYRSTHSTEGDERVDSVTLVRYRAARMLRDVADAIEVSTFTRAFFAWVIMIGASLLVTVTARFVPAIAPAGGVITSALFTVAFVAWRLRVLNRRRRRPD